MHIAQPVFSMPLQKIVQPQLRGVPHRGLQVRPARFSEILTFPKQIPLIMYCSRRGTFGNERHLPSVGKCSLSFRESCW